MESRNTTRSSYTGAGFWSESDEAVKTNSSSNQQVHRNNMEAQQACQNNPQDTERSNQSGPTNQERSLSQQLRGMVANQRANNVGPERKEHARCDNANNEQNGDPQEGPLGDPTYEQKIYPLTDDYDRFGNRIS